MISTKFHVNESPLKKAGLLSRLFFCWLNDLMRKGCKKTLNEDDLYNILENDSSSHLANRLEREWLKEVSKKKPSLVKALIRCFGAELGWLGIIVLLEEATRLAQPMLLVNLLAYFSADNSFVSTTNAYLFALGLSLTSAFLALVHHPYFFYNGVISMRMRIASCSLIYRKSLRLSNRALSQATTGHVITLMTSDANRFDYATLFLHYLWVAPIQAVVVLVILWNYIGASSLAGFALLIIFTPLQAVLGRMFSRLRLKTAAETDQRVRLMEQLIAGMKVVKMYCWEKPFTELVAAVRRAEISWVFKSTMCALPYWVLPQVLPKICVFLCCITYVSLGNALRISLVIILVATFDILKFSVFFSMPFAISKLAETYSSCLRLQAFLLLEEVDSHLAIQPPSVAPADCEVTLDSVSAKWVESNDALTLQNVTANVKAGELLAVIGAVGAGKTSLLMAVLGELQCTTGQASVKGSIAYAPQQPWIFSGTVRQNILFGKPFDQVKYEKVMCCCALEKDFLLLPYGDLTLVGDRGVSLSGGQRARISLARAVYSEASVYLLDDPLSAVDAAVSKHLFTECINGVLRDRPRILVTHQLQYLKAATRILILKNGAMLGLGTYDELSSKGLQVTQFLEHSSDDILGPCHSPPHARRSGHLPASAQDPHSLPPTHAPPLVRTLSVSDESLEQADMTVPDQPHLLAVPAAVARVTPHRFPSTASLAAQLANSRGSLSAMMAFEDANVHRGREATTADIDDANSALLAGSEVTKATMMLPQQHSHTEAVAEGTVPFSVYKNYFTAGGEPVVLFFAAVLLLVSQGAFVVCDWWLSHWSSKEEAYLKSVLVAVNRSSFNENFPNSPDSINIQFSVPRTLMEQNSTFMYIYIGLMVASIIFSCLRMIVFFKICVGAAKHLHGRMFTAIMRSPMRFFDVNPIGRILNRFSKDVGNIDDLLPGTFYDFISCFLLILGVIVLAAAINPWVLIIVAPIVGVFLYVRKYYLCTSRAVKRMESTTRSPVISHQNATLMGLYSVRAFRMQAEFVSEFDQHQDLHTEAWYLFLATNRWLAIRLDWLCVTFICAVAFISVIAKDNLGLSANLVGLTVTYAISLMGVFQWGVRQSAEVENYMTSVERILEYVDLSPEAPLETDVRPSPGWPAQGAITAESACLKYATDEPFVLKDVTFAIKGGEKIGICGRTGAGKSSLIAMLFRLCEHSGKVTIDNLNIADIGLHDLRSKISIIPQEPVLFGGNIRRNLDPFGHHSDGSLNNALAQVQLLQAVQDLPGGLDAPMSENGSNFSAGQQQLLCLARALLRKNRILVVDEATANVDPRTDSLIQDTIKEYFNSFTVLTIAHRLNTIIESDRIMVLDQGQLMEFDEPYALLQRPESLFYSLVQQAGSAQFSAMLALAKAASKKRSATTARVIAREDGVG